MSIRSEKIHKDVCDELHGLYINKNRDYGDSFHQSFVEEGMAMPRIRLSDKLNRFKTLTKSGEQNVKNESVRDTLMDLANYAIMTVMELDMQSKTQVEDEARNVQFMEDVICLLNHFNGEFGHNDNWYDMSEAERERWFNDFAVKHAHGVRFYE